MENARKVTKHIQRIGKHLNVYGEYGKLGLFAVHKIVFEYAESIKTYSENKRKESMAYAYTEKTQRDFQRFLVIRQET
jgi:hypothetical protein